ncbi:MAG: YegP family protein, partial [Nannocystales bacterium]
MAAEFDIYKDNTGEFRFRLKAANSQNILASEGYATKAGAEDGITAVKTNAP